MNRLFSCVALITCLYSSTAAGEQILVDCQGSGQPVYLVVGGPAFTSKHLVPIQQQLRDRFRVCRWDMRGVGNNAALPIKQDMTVLEQWLLDMAAILPKQPVVLWGQSWGGLQSLLFASRYPERVKAIILSNPVDPELVSLEHIERKRYLHPYVAAQLTLDDMGTDVEKRHGFRSKIASYFVDAEQGWAFSDQFDHNDTNSQLNVQVWQEYRQQPLSTQALKQLTAKISSVIYCRQDVLMPENLERYSSALPAVQHHIIDGCAHFPWEEKPEQYYELLRQSLSD
jgi:pimeloyl-ACP methyl ester carboxylesterase